MIGRSLMVLTMVAALAVAPVAIAGSSTKDIVDTAVAAGNFTTLAKALKSAGLVDTLKGLAPSPCSLPPMKPLRSFPPEPWKTS
jgi:hypothetical protein